MLVSAVQISFSRRAGHFGVVVAQSFEQNVQLCVKNLSAQRSPTLANAVGDVFVHGLCTAFFGDVSEKSKSDFCFHWDFQQLVCKPRAFLLKSQHSLESTSLVSSKNAGKTPQMYLYGTSTGSRAYRTSNGSCLLL